MRLSVAILTWNTINTLKETLEILRNDLKDIECEIIIVDNGSTDGCRDLATIRNAGNLGISTGKNQGIEASKGEFILLLDGDIVPVPNSVNHLLEWIEKHPSCEAIGFYPNKWSKQKNGGGQKHHESYCENLYDPSISTGACIYYGMYRRSVFDKGVRCPVHGVFAQEGYGWEDHWFFEEMKARNIVQWVAGINHAAGKYYHEINSSVRQMGWEQYVKSSKIRHEAFEKKWGK